MKPRILIAVTMAALLISAGVLWLNRGRRDKASEPVKDPLAKLPSLAESQRLDEERRRLAADYEKKVAEFFASQQAREEALRKELAQAREEDRQRLEQEIAQLRQSMEGYASSLGAWRNRVDQETPAPSEPSPVPQTVPDFEAPPTPPAPPGEEDEGAGDDPLQTLLPLAAAGLCLAEPPLCPAILLFTKILGSLGTIKGGREVIETIGQVQRGEPVSADHLNDLLALADENQDLREPLGEILGTLLDEKDDASSAGDLAGVILELTPGETGGIPTDILQEIQRDAPCETLKSFLERDGSTVRFASREQRRAVHIGLLSLRSPEITRRFWDNCLASLGTE